MSFVIVVSTSSVLYTPPNGSENAFAGQTISSATWNATFTDLSNNGLAVVGKSGAKTLKGNNTSAIGVVADMTVAQANALLGTGVISFPVRGVNFNPSVATDLAISVNSPTTRYTFNALFITNASGTLSTSAVGLFTATGGGGLTVIGSATLTVTTSLADAVGNAQLLTSSIINTVAFSDSTFQFRVIVPQGGAATADVILYVRPM